MGSTHTYQQDPRNADIQISINGELFHRDKAMISVFDSGFILGDGIWEGLRLHHGVIPFLDRHMRRLWEGAKALDLDLGLSKEALQQRLYDTIDANNMADHVHIRLMVSRGIKATPYQDPAVTVSGPTIVIIPEYKNPDPGLNDRGRGFGIYASIHADRDVSAFPPEHVPEPPHLIVRAGDELLASEARLDGHNEHEVQFVKQALESLKRRCGP